MINSTNSSFRLEPANGTTEQLERGQTTIWILNETHQVNDNGRRLALGLQQVIDPLSC